MLRARRVKKFLSRSFISYMFCAPTSLICLASLAHLIHLAHFVKITLSSLFILFTMSAVESCGVLPMQERLKLAVSAWEREVETHKELDNPRQQGQF